MENLVAPGRRERGLTLVELMVTLVIAGLVTSSSFMFFAGQRRVYDAQMKVLGVQQNLWGAMETLSRFVRAAGTGMVGCVNTTDPTPTGTTPPATGLRAFVSSAPGTVTRLAPIWINNGAAGALMVIEVDTWSSGMPSKSARMSSIESIATPTLPTSPRANGSSES